MFQSARLEVERRVGLTEGMIDIEMIGRKACKGCGVVVQPLESPFTW